MHLLIGMPGAAEFILILFALSILILQILALIDIIKSHFKEPMNKIVWTIVVVLLPIVGSILYFSIGRAQREIVK